VRFLAVLLLALLCFFAAHQVNPVRHYGIGRWDRAWLADAGDFSPPLRMEGPVRHPDGSVEVRDFVGRLTKKRAAFRIPYHALRTPLELRLRCHRFGLEGTAVLSINGRHIEDFIFTKTSYPWGGIRAIVPREIAEEGPLSIEILVQGAEAPPPHLPPDLGLGVDWLEIAPSSKGAIVLPVASQWLSFLLLLISSSIFLVWVGIGARGTTAAAIALVLLVAAMVAVQPATTSSVLSWAWLSFPLLMLVLWCYELADRLLPAWPARSSATR
jgi:hypothetical protein